MPSSNLITVEVKAFVSSRDFELSQRFYAEPGATSGYSWGRNVLRFVRCGTCGCITHWERTDPVEGSRMGVNARNFDPDALGPVRIRLLDGASDWEGLERAGT